MLPSALVYDGWNGIECQLVRVSRGQVQRRPDVGARPPPSTRGPDDRAGSPHVAAGGPQIRLADPGPLAEDMDMPSDVTVVPSKPAGR